MKGIEQQYLRVCIEALCKAHSALLQLSCEEAIAKTSYGKRDCLGLDAATEWEITKAICKDFDPYLPFITEEIGSAAELQDTRSEQVVCFSDPMDRSKPLAEFLSKYAKETIESIFQQDKFIDEWEVTCGGDVELSGPYGSITAVRHDSIIFNVMINYITGDIYVASDERVGKLLLTEAFEAVR